MDIDEQFQHSLELKEEARRKASGDVIVLAKVLENVQKIAKEKSSIEKELKWKEQEYRQLSELKEKDESFFQMKINKKKEKMMCDINKNIYLCSSTVCMVHIYKVAVYTGLLYVKLVSTNM